MKRIVLTGGGTAGHVTPNLALIPELKKAGYEISYIGSYNGIEKGLLEQAGIPYYGISSGKFRRYFDIKNAKDPFRVLKGYFEARKLFKDLKPDVVFSKGGYVAVPVVVAAHKKGIPCIIHESDLTPGLANKICIPSATKICVNFPETVRYFPEGKAVLTGTPIRKELFLGDAEKGRRFCGFSKEKPILLVIGGSTGSAALNEAIRNLLPTLLKSYQVVHSCGKGKTDPKWDHTQGYRQFAYINDEMRDLLAMADVVISRAGANSICELLALRKPNILIPLPKKSSRGDQILNADSFENQGYSYVIKEEELTNDTLLRALTYVTENKQTYMENMGKSNQMDTITHIMKLIEEASKPCI